LGFSWPAFARRVRNKLTDLARRLYGTLRGEKVHTDVGSFMDTSYFSATQASFMNALYRALCAYIPKPYAGQAILYEARTQPLYHLLEAGRIWSKVATHIEVVMVRGTHVSIVLQPYINLIADDLRKRLSRLADEGV